LRIINLDGDFFMILIY